MTDSCPSFSPDCGYVHPCVQLHFHWLVVDSNMHEFADVLPRTPCNLTVFILFRCFDKQTLAICPVFLHNLHSAFLKGHASRLCFAKSQPWHGDSVVEFVFFNAL